MIKTQRQTYYGLTELNGPYPLKKGDKQHLREKDPVWLGGGVPAGGRAHAGHANWLVTTGYPHRSDGYSRQAEIKNYPKADTGNAYQSLVSYQSDHKNQAAYNQGIFGVPPGSSPFLASRTGGQFGAAGTMQPPPGFFPITGLAPGSIPVQQQAQETQTPPLTTETGTMTESQMQDLFNDSDPRPDLLASTPTSATSEGIDNGVVMTSTSVQVSPIVTETQAAQIQTDVSFEPSTMFPGRNIDREIDMMAEGLTTTAIRDALRESPLTNNAQVDARTAPRSYVDAMIQTDEARRTLRVQTQTSPVTPVQTIINTLVDNETNTSPLPVPSVVTNGVGVQTERLQGLTLGDHVVVFESLTDQRARLEAQAQTSPVTVLSAEERAAIEARHQEAVQAGQELGYEAGVQVGTAQGLQEGAYQGYLEGYAAGQSTLNPPVYTQSVEQQTSPPPYRRNRSRSMQTENPILRSIGIITEAEGAGQGQAAALARRTVTRQLRRHSAPAKFQEFSWAARKERARQLQIMETRRGSGPSELQTFIEPTIQDGAAMVPNPRRVMNQRSAATPVTGQPSTAPTRGRRTMIQVGGVAERTARAKGARQPGVNRSRVTDTTRRRSTGLTSTPLPAAPTTPSTASPVTPVSRRRSSGSSEDTSPRAQRRRRRATRR